MVEHSVHIRKRVGSNPSSPTKEEGEWVVFHYDEESETEYHVMPEKDIIEHRCHWKCECQPTKEYRDPITWREVWVHKDLQARENLH